MEEQAENLGTPLMQFAAVDDSPIESKQNPRNWGLNKSSFSSDGSVVGDPINLTALIDDQRQPSQAILQSPRPVAHSVRSREVSFAMKA